MKTSNETDALRQAIELAKVICANPNCNILPTEKTAKELAAFIRTLEADFTRRE